MPVTRYILDVATDEEVVITLDDGSRYEVAGDDTPTATLWYGSQKARIMPSRDKVFPVRHGPARWSELRPEPRMMAVLAP